MNTPTPSPKLTLLPRPLLTRDIESHPALLHTLSDVHLRSFLTNAVYAAIYPAGYAQPIIDASVARHGTAIMKDASVRYVCVVAGRMSATSTSADGNGERRGGSASERESGSSVGAAHHGGVDSSGEECWCLRIVAFGKYQLFSTAAEQAARKDTSERIWPEGTNVALVNGFWGRIQEVRAKWGPRLGAHVQLDLLATSPEFMGRGAGGMIVRHVARVCDEGGLPGFLEGSPEGLMVYLKSGWRDMRERVRIDLGRYKGGKDRGADWRAVEKVREGEEGWGCGWYENVVMVRPARGRRIEEYLDQ